MAADFESLLCDMEGLDSPPPNPVQELSPTTYSLLDMELTGVTELAMPLTPANVTGPKSPQDGEPQATLQDTVTVPGLHQQLQEVTHAQIHHRKELSGKMEQMSNTITTQIEQVSNTLSDLIQEQRNHQTHGHTAGIPKDTGQRNTGMEVETSSH